LLSTRFQSEDVGTKVKSKIALSEDDRALFDKKLKKKLLHSKTYVRKELKRTDYSLKNPDYTIEELKGLRDELNSKCVFIKEGNKNKYSTLDKDSIFKKDYYINMITEKTALSFKDMLHHEFLVNKHKDCSIEKNIKLVKEDALKKIVNLNKIVRGKFFDIMRNKN
jgi:hypothetical protein